MKLVENNNHRLNMHYGSKTFYTAKYINGITKINYITKNLVVIFHNL